LAEQLFRKGLTGRLERANLGQQRTKELRLSANRSGSLGNGRLRRRYLARRLEILRAAGKQFRVHGFAETGMRDIAAAADLSPANLYNYFGGKHEILFFCQDNSLDRMLAALEETRSTRTAAAEKLRAVITSHLSCLLDEVEGSTAHLLASALPPLLQRRLVKKRDRYEQGLRQLIAAGIRAGEFIPCDPALAVRAMLGALNWSVLWFRPEGSLSVAEIARDFADYLVRGLLVAPVAASERPPHVASRPTRPRGVRSIRKGRSSRLAERE
jgi:AcrR family transcriptional regulator